jgi:phosphatidylserine/phosphatidylglycerophosphate/cardiolipin synthase-like enzyme
LQILDLAKWYSDIVPTPGRAWPARFRSQSRFQGLVDGPPVFRRLFPEMEAALGVHLAGWAFKEFPLDPNNPESTLLKLIAKQREKYRLLVAQFFRPRTGAISGETTTTELAIIYFALLAIANPLMVIDVQQGDADIRGVLTFQALVALAYAAMMFANIGEDLESVFRGKAEKTDEDVRADVYVKTPLIGYPSRHLARISDNPVSGGLTLPDGRAIADLQQHFSVHHTKMQVLFMPGPTPTYIGYVGGTDINSNRVNSAGHQGSGFRKPDSTSPPTAATFHDVHARITGLAAYDVAGIYQDRYEFEAIMGDDGTVPDPLFNQNAPRLPPAFTLPDTPDDVQPAGSHLVQVARTTYAPAAGSNGYPWSNGEAPIRFTFERAVAEAREYIYIEEQYLTPDNGFVAALRNAADHCRRLVILIPASADQPFGEQRRLAIVDRLSGATGGAGGWGDRMIVGTPFRRPVLAPAQRKISHGRMTLIEDVSSASQPEIFVGPVKRVPTGTPYFFWVGGELMCAVKTQKVTSPGGHEAVRIEVLRGGLGTQPRWCPHPRQHQAGAPVTVAEPRAIFVHSKIMIVDDIFVGVGSANYNRRGHFHDGEVTAFAIPDRLRAAADNPALQLRAELWAEHLGISPEMGRALLADPMAAFELFRRSRYQGNRLTPFHEFRVPAAELSGLASHTALQLLPLSVRVMLLATLQAGLMTQIPDLWNTLSDPTTNTDPNPTPGPDLP